MTPRSMRASLLIACWIAALAAALLPSCAARPAPPASEHSLRAIEGDRYYLSTCALCDALLGTRGEVVDETTHARHLRFCNAACHDRFAHSPDESLARIDRVLIADQLPHYPLRVSIVSGEPLGDAPLDFIAGNRLFRVRSAGERSVVHADPEAYFDKLDRAVIAAQSGKYAMPDKCPVQGDILDSDTPIDIVIANRMIRLCCLRCVQVVRARPSQYLGMVDYANRAAAQTPH